MQEKGQIVILGLIVLTLVTINTVIIISRSLSFSQNSKYTIENIQATNLAEAAIDKATASLNATGGTYNGESETNLGLGTYEVTITDKDASTKLITATGYVPNKSAAKSTKKITIQLSKGSGISFSYGLQVGNGGIQMGNGARINGSVYSNGNVTTGNGAIVTGDIYVAGGTQPTPNQQSSCIVPNCQDFLFGKNISGNNQLDIAQSFTPSTQAVINKVSLRLKKINSPANATVRILGDSAGKPNKNNVITSGTLASSLVTTQYGDIDVTFANAPTLNADTPYWVMIDTSSDTNNYWAWESDSTQGYNGGNGKWSADWQAGNPVWNNISGDLGFKVYMGGVSTYVDLSGGSTVNGSVHANSIRNATINGSAYYQTVVNTTVNGSSFPNSADPPPTVMPISDANISSWKAEAETAGITTGDITGCPSTLGPRKIVGNLSINNGCTVTVKSPLWITGNMTFGNGAILKLDTTSGASSGVVIVDGVTVFGNGANLVGSGTSGSFLMLLSTYDSTSSELDAISTGNSSISGIIYAPYGQVSLANGATFKEIAAWKIIMGNNAILNYDTGLAGLFFSSGPSGAFSVVKGTYQSK